MATYISFIVTALPSIVTASPETGGFLEDAGSASVRQVLGADLIQSFLPERGPFTFPSPYNTQAVRLTNSRDCAGQDCVNYAGYSYWRNMNNHVGMDSMLVFLGLDQNRGGNGPTLFELNKHSGEIRNLGALFPSDSHLSWATGEGWYFSATMPTKLYVNDGPRIARFDVISGQMETVADVTDKLGSGYLLWQMHSSDDDRVHSATVRDASSYQTLGCMAYEEDRQRYHYFPFERDFDECQIDRSGEWLVIKADLDGKHGEDNLIVNLKTGHERVLLDQDGAAGHSDVGHGYMIAADNWADNANTWKLWDFNQRVLQGERVYHNTDWTVSAPNHLSHTNARPDTPIREQYACGSSVNRRMGPHANEIICFNLDGSESTLVVAPVMTDLNAAGGGDNYAKAPKGNLDVTGRYFLWTSNTGGSRLDAYIVRVPDHLLTHTADGNPVTGVDTSESDTELPQLPEDATADTAIVWHDTRNVTVSGNSIGKTSGCNGCADAGAISAQSVAHGTASLYFTAAASGPMVSAGFTNQQIMAGGNDTGFSIRLQQGIAEVREMGVYQADVSFAAGDRFTIVVDDGQVKYLRNGTVFHTSATTAEYPLFAGVTLYNTDASLHDVRLTDADGSQVTKVEAAEPETVPPLLVVSAPADHSILWHDTTNVTVEETSITKTSGCHGCGDAGAVSLQSVAYGNASVDFTAEASGPLLSAGLTNQQAITSDNELDFSVRLQQGIAEVREHGVYRADVRFAAGDRFNIVINNGQVKYLRNGNVFHTSTSSAQGPLFAGLIFNSTGAKVKNMRFVVDESPQLTAMIVNQRQAGELEINWRTDRPAESLVQFGVTAQLGSDSDHNTRLSQEHQVVLQGLIPGGKYHFRALNRDTDGHISGSGTLTVTVPK